MRRTTTATNPKHNSIHVDGSGTAADSGAAKGSAAPPAGAKRIAKVVAPDGVVGDVDDTVAVAVGSEHRGRAEVGLPEAVIFRADGAVAAVVAGQARIAT